MRYDTVIFDLDGTLTNSHDGITNAVCYALSKMNLPIPDEAGLRKYIGPPLVDSFQRYAGMDAAAAERGALLFREYYVPTGRFENQVYPGIRELLKALHDGGAKVLIATGKPEETSWLILKHFGLDGYIDGLSGPSDSTSTAEKGELIARVLRGVSYQHAVMIGDRGSDIEGAHQAGVDSIAVGYGFGEADELQSAQPTHIAPTVDALSAMLLGFVPKRHGYFITMEGLDGCGKTTQSDAVEKALRDRGYTVRRSREPGGCPISEKIRTLLLDVANTGMDDITEAMLYAAARAQHVRQVILPALQEGDVVLCDRFVDSSVAFQGGGRELGVALIEQINVPAIEGCLPDATIYLRLDHETALKRRANASALDRIEQEKAAFHARVEAAYEELAVRHAQRFICVDAARKPKEITDDILQALFTRMQTAGVA